MNFRSSLLTIFNFGSFDIKRFLAACNESLIDRSIEPLRYFFAESAFLSGKLPAALARFQAIPANSRFKAKATLMQDWIRFHQGDLSGGWPRYPGAKFQEEPLTYIFDATVPVGYVSDPRCPKELVTQLGMRQWIASEKTQQPLLVWFNFRNSLGGEILASRLLPLFRTRYQSRLILACSPRMTGIFERSFPDCQIFDISSSLSQLEARCSHFILARDLLKLLIRSEEDFASPAREKLRTQTQTRTTSRKLSSKPNVGIAWKTTNREQGRYRNPPLSDLAKILGKHDFEWHIAQHGDVSKDLSVMRRYMPDRSLHTDTLHPSADMATFGSELVELDAVVTIDNSLLHLAGGLGVKTFALLTIPCYWAWPEVGMRSRWYSEVRLLRQKRPNDWGAVLNSLDIALADLVSEHKNQKTVKTCKIDATIISSTSK